MNVCDINNFIDYLEEFNSDKDNKIIMDSYQFNPVDKEVVISKGDNNVVIDLTLSVDDQLSAFQLFLDGLS